MEKHYLSKSILSNGLESLFDVDGFLSAGLKVRNLILGLAPGLCPLGRHGPVVQIDLVAQDNKREVVGVSGARLQQKTIRSTPNSKPQPSPMEFKNPNIGKRTEADTKIL